MFLKNIQVILKGNQKLDVIRMRELVIIKNNSKYYKKASNKMIKKHYL